MTRHAIGDPILVGLPRFGYSADADLQADDRQVAWAEQREQNGFDSTDLWSYDAIFMRVLRHLMPHVSGISDPDTAAITAMLDLYAREANCSPRHQVQVALHEGHNALYRALRVARLPCGTLLAQPLARHALPRLAWFQVDLSGRHDKSAVGRKRAIKRVMRAFRLVETQGFDALSFREARIFWQGMAQFLKLLPGLWT